MASKFWVGGTGPWDGSTTTNWATSSGGAGGTAIPAANDSVTFDANSGTGVCTISVTTGELGQLTMTNCPAGLTFAGSGNILVGRFSSLAIALPTSAVSLAITLNLLGSHTVTSNGSSLAAITIGVTANVATVLTLADNMVCNGQITVGSSLNVSLTTIALAGHNLTSASIIRATTTGGFTISGTATINLTAASTTCWDPLSTTTLTVPNTVTFNLTATGSSAFQGRNLSTYGTITCASGSSVLAGANTIATVNITSGTLSFSGSNTITSLTVSPGATMLLSTGLTQTVTNITANGTSGNLVTIRSAGSPTQTTISKSSGAVTFAFISLDGIIGAGGATYTVPDAKTSVNKGTNTNIVWIYKEAAALIGLAN